MFLWIRLWWKKMNNKIGLGVYFVFEEIYDYQQTIEQQLRNREQYNMCNKISLRIDVLLCMRNYSKKCGS